MSQVDKHLEKAFASLDDLSVRELVATAEAIGGRRHALHDFSSIFRNVATARGSGWSTDIARLHIRKSVEGADAELIERIADAEAPFWQPVRSPLRKRSGWDFRPSSRATRRRRVGTSGRSVCLGLDWPNSRWAQLGQY